MSVDTVSMPFRSRFMLVDIVSGGALLLHQDQIPDTQFYSPHVPEANTASQSTPTTAADGEEMPVGTYGGLGGARRASARVGARARVESRAPWQ